MKQPCNKTIFTTEVEAKTKLKEIQAEPPREDGKVNRKGRHVKPRRAYYCPTCGGWHLTSYTVAKMQAIKRNAIRSVAQEWVRKKGWDK